MILVNRRARASFVSLAKDMQWLRPKFEKFKPSNPFAGVWLLVIRLLQTSFCALVPSQITQAAVVCTLTLISISLQRELSPYRRLSDNKCSLLFQWLIFAWVSCECSGLARASSCSNRTALLNTRPQVFVLMLRIAGVFTRAASALAIGVLLCAATVAVIVTGFVLSNNDRIEEQRSERSYSSADEHPSHTSSDEHPSRTSSDEHPDENMKDNNEKKPEAPEEGGENHQGESAPERPVEVKLVAQEPYSCTDCFSAEI